MEGDCSRFWPGGGEKRGHGLIRTMVTKRTEGGPFRNLEDFLERMGEGELNKRAVENFIKCGAMDCFGCHRSELLAVYESMMDAVSSTRKKNLEGQMGLFSMLSDTPSAVSITIPHLPELPRGELMAMEKETTGIYISGHPMDAYRQKLKNTSVVPIGALLAEESQFRDEQIVSIAGIIQTVKTKLTRSNSTMAYVTMEDDTASIEMIAFSGVLNEYGGYLKENTPVVVVGKLSLRDDKEPQVIVNRVRLISDYTESAPRREEQPAQEIPQGSTLYLRLPNEDCREFRKIKAIVNMFPGDGQVIVFFADTRKRMGVRCMLHGSMIGELKRLLGEENVILK